VGEARDVSDPVTLVAHAKLTLSLRVTGVRADGYHFLDTEMVSIDLADVLQITAGDGMTVLDEVIGGRGVEGVPLGEANLVSRALSLVDRRAHIRLTKRIPPAAGLGGGSSDAAAILRWAGTTEPGLAVRIGADVPFCVRGGRARVRGVGEVVEPLEHEERTFVLLLPPLDVSTQEVYRAWDDLEARAVTRSRANRDTTDNDLETAALAVQPLLGGWRDRFSEVTGLRPRLAGSGSTWFVEGEPSVLGIEGMSEIVMDNERAVVLPVKTLSSSEIALGS
jgi:4-diphosphocytidyl-2-C-methyl-D-erythritol kinase